MFIRKSPIVITLALTITLGSLVVIGWPRAEDPVVVSPPSETVAGELSLPSTKAAPLVQNINVQNTSFSPANVTVSAGTTLHWIWVNGIHSTTSGTCCTADGTWDSSTLGPGATFDYTPMTPGVYPYYCEIHGVMMTGTVTVTPATAAGATITGRVLDASGRGLKAGSVTLTDVNGETRTARVGRHGYYMFSDVPTGQTYQIAAVSRRFEFSPLIISVNDNLAGVDFFPSTGKVDREGGAATSDRKPISWTDTKICGPLGKKSA